MDSFATVQDYEDRYGDVEDTAQLGVLLSDASAYIAAQPGFEYADSTDPRYEVQWANLTRVTCSVVHRALSAGDLAGMSSYSEGGVGYTASVSVANPSEDFYLTKSEPLLRVMWDADKAALGIGAGRVGSTWGFACPRPEEVKQ